MDPEELTERLEAAFGGSPQIRRAVARQARDLADSGRIEDALGYQLTAEAVISNLDDAPEEHGLVERWNWWIGSLELADGNYQRFRVRPDISPE